MNEENKGERQSNEEKQPRHERPRIYVTSLSDYNAGVLHGRWIDAARPVEELWADIEAMLAESHEPIAEEWAIHDYEYFGKVWLGEYEDLQTVSKIALGISEHGQAFAAWASMLGSHEMERLDDFEEAYLGTWSSVEEYAEQLLGDLGAMTELEKIVSESLRPYVSIDIEGFARDLELGGDIMSVDDGDGVHIFDGHR